MPKKWQICILLLAATTLNYLDRQTLSILAPVLQKELRLSNADLGWLFAVFYYVYTFALFAAGPILDRSHLRWVFGGAVFLWSVVSVLTGLANGFAALLVFRLALGLVEATNWPAATRVVARSLEPRERALGNGIYTSGTSIAALIAPGLILGIAAMFGWRMAFVLIGSLGAIWIVAWFAMTRAPELGPVWRDPDTPASKPHVGQRKIFADIFGSPRFLPVLVVSVLVNPSLYFSVNWLPTYFSQQRGLSPGRQMGWILTAIYLGLDIGNLACGAMILALTRRGRPVQQSRRVVFLLATAAVVGCAAVPVLPMSGAVAALIVVNFGLGIWVSIYLTMTQEVLSTHPSTALGVLSGCGSLAGALSMWAVGRVTQQTASFTIPMSAVALAALVSAAAGWMASTELKPAPLSPAPGMST